MNRHERRRQAAAERKLEEGAVRRQKAIAANEFKIRAMKQEAIKNGDGDCIVLILDLADPLAKQIYNTFLKKETYYRLGQPVRPGDTVQLVCASYPPLREMFSPTHRMVFDRCSASDIRVAMLSEGRTTAVIVYADQKMEGSPVLITMAVP